MSKTASSMGGKTMAMAARSNGPQARYQSKEKEKDVRRSNIAAAKSVADCIRTSLGPRGMDKMITAGNGEVTITNDGATILSKLKVQHPAAKMFVELSKSQDIEAGDGTTSVVVLAGALAGAAETLLDKGIHPAVISAAFLKAERQAQRVLRALGSPIAVTDEAGLLAAASTSLNSKVVNQYSQTLAPMAVKAVLKVIDPARATNVDLNDIRVVTMLGGTVDDTELVDGLVFAHKSKQAPGAPKLVEQAKVALIQFCLSAPKTNIENNVVVSDYTQMDRLLKEERRYILKLCKEIQKTGANVLLIQKSILRDATSDLALHFLAKMKIMVVSDIERSDIELVCRNLGCQPIASVEGLSASKLGYADRVEEEKMSGGSIVRLTGVGKTASDANAAAKPPGPKPAESADKAAEKAAAAAAAADDEKKAADDKAASGAKLSEGAAAAAAATASEAKIAASSAVCVLVRGSNNLVVAEAERSLHDALCVVRSLVKCRMLAPGGGAPEIEIALRLAEWARTLPGLDAYCVRAYADAMELIPYTLAENSGLNPIEMVTKLRAAHAAGDSQAGINVRRGTISNSSDAGIVQPLLVNSSALMLATETIVQLLKIDDIVQTRGGYIG